MNTGLVFETGRFLKCLVTLITVKLFFSIMNHNVSLQVTILGEFLLTFIAGIWVLFSMDLHVTIQVASLGGYLVTFLAWMCFHPNMELYVTLQTVDKEFGFRYKVV